MCSILGRSLPEPCHYPQDCQLVAEKDSPGSFSCVLRTGMVGSRAGRPLPGPFHRPQDCRGSREVLPHHLRRAVLSKGPAMWIKIKTNTDKTFGLRKDYKY